MDKNGEKNQKKKEKNSLLAGVRRSANNRIYIPLRTGDRTQAKRSWPELQCSTIWPESQKWHEFGS